MTIKNTLIIGCLLLTITACTGLKIKSSQQSLAVSSEDMQGAQRAIGLDKGPATTGKEPTDSALIRLRTYPKQAIAAWKRHYQTASSFYQRSYLLFVLGELCIPEGFDALSEIANIQPAGSKQSPGHHLPSPYAKQEMLQRTSFRGMTKIAGPVCSAINRRRYSTSSGQNYANTFEQWLFDKSGSKDFRRYAGEALLVAFPERAAQLRQDLSSDKQWMLTPFEERRVTMEVFDHPPDFDGSSRSDIDSSDVARHTTQRILPTVPLEAISDSCKDKLDTGFKNFDGDSYLDNVMYWRAWFGIESIWGMQKRYDRLIDFQDNTWDEGFGWNDVTNNSKPFRRALNSLFLIEHAGPSPNPPGDYSGSIINYAWDYVQRKTPEFEGSCATNSFATAYTCWLGIQWFCDEKIVLKMRLWDTSPPVRAGTIIHETRHSAGYDHNGGDNCPEGVSCDYQYSDGRANTREIQWLAQYYRMGKHATASMKEAALREANRILKWHFVVCPKVQLDEENAYFYREPELCD